MHSLRQKLAFLAAAGIAIWVPRGLALDRFVTVDEPSWLTFSGNFYHALAHGDFGGTFQIAHPGVTTTWIGTAAFLLRYPGYAADAPGQVNWIEQEIGPFVRAQGHDPVELLATGRALLVLAVTGILGAAAVAAARLLGPAAALLGILLIASDPFQVALSRVLHVDALMSSFMLLSVLACLNYLYNGRRRTDLALSGVAAGLAWLTKAPAAFLVPFVGGLMLLRLWPIWRAKGASPRLDVRRELLPFFAWGSIGCLVFVLCWPAMWVDPIGSVRSIAGEAIGYARSGHGEAPLFFNGAIVRGDPGWLFYPVTYLWRTTPSVLIGLALAAIAWAAPRAGFEDRSHRRLAGMLLLFALLYMLVMTAGAKKFDRYLLPIYAPLTLVAALGWLAAAGWLRRGLPGLPRSWPLAACAGVAIAVQVALAVPAFPYYFSYYNPLLGGTRRAPGVMMIGWGEGLDQAARYLNGIPSAERLRVTTWFWNGTFSYLFKGQSVPGRFTPDPTAVRQWRTAGYCVLYINQRQRGRLPPELLEYTDRLTPARVIRIQGLEYAWIYDLRGVPVPAFLLGARPDTFAVAGD